MLGLRVRGATLGAGGVEVITVAGLSLMMTREGKAAWVSTLGLPRK